MWKLCRKIIGKVSLKMCIYIFHGSIALSLRMDNIWGFPTFAPFICLIIYFPPSSLLFFLIIPLPAFLPFLILVPALSLLYIFSPFFLMLLPTHRRVERSLRYFDSTSFLRIATYFSIFTETTSSGLFVRMWTHPSSHRLPSWFFPSLPLRYFFFFDSYDNFPWTVDKRTKFLSYIIWHITNFST